MGKLQYIGDSQTSNSPSGNNEQNRRKIIKWATTPDGFQGLGGQEQVAPSLTTSGIREYDEPSTIVVTKTRYYRKRDEESDDK